MFLFCILIVAVLSTCPTKISNPVVSYDLTSPDCTIGPVGFPLSCDSEVQCTSNGIFGHDDEGTCRNSDIHQILETSITSNMFTVSFDYTLINNMRIFIYSLEFSMIGFGNDIRFFITDHANGVCENSAARMIIFPYQASGRLRLEIFSTSFEIYIDDILVGRSTIPTFTGIRYDCGFNKLIIHPQSEHDLIGRFVISTLEKTFFNCFGQRCDEENVCHNHGTCTAEDTCACELGWNGVGDGDGGGSDCRDPICDPECVNGACDAPFHCACQPGWGGSACHVPICDNPECVHGTCTGPNVCTCEPGWKGPDCDECDFPQPNCNPACKNEGVCLLTAEGESVCHCKDGFRGSLCEIPIGEYNTSVCCNGKQAKESGVCGTGQKSNGVCLFTGVNPDGTLKPGRCRCYCGYEGEFCTDHVVKGRFKKKKRANSFKCPITECNPKCKHGGKCICGGVCDCHLPWGGSDCSVRLPCNPLCQHGGKCNDALECECTPNFTGVDCGTRL